MPAAPAPRDYLIGLDVVAQARTWLGTPFHHNQCQKGVGVDCVHLVIGVARELGLVAPDFDVPAYPRRPDGVTLLTLANMHMDRVAPSEMALGDMAVVRIKQDPQHVGIIGDYRGGGFSFIHARDITGRERGKVVEVHFGPWHRGMLVAVYRLRGLR